METSPQTPPVAFAPMLYLNNVAAAIAFYTKAFNAKELQRWSNPDGSVHVAEMTIENSVFHLHEESPKNNELGPHTLKGTSIVIGLFVQDVDEVTAKAITHGATETSAIQDYDYGYRQGSLTDPFGHHWVIEKRI